MILDSHPSLLTIGWHGLSSFVVLWKVFLKDKTVKEALEHLRKPNGEPEAGLLNVNLRHMLKYKYAERLPAFLDGLSLYLDPEKSYGLHDWFKAFYLSANAACGRKFLQRIAPAIFSDVHALNQYQQRIKFNITKVEFENMEKEVQRGFKYTRRAGVVRSPLGTLGSRTNFATKTLKSTARWLKYPLGVLEIYANEDFG